MSSRRAVVSLPVVAVALILALTGCSRLGAQGSASSTGAAPSAPSAATTSSSAPAAPEAATLGDISSDLGAADTANTEAGSNASAGDQAAATNDDR